jgi:hypothetical protein
MDVRQSQWGKLLHMRGRAIDAHMRARQGMGRRTILACRGNLCSLDASMSRCRCWNFKILASYQRTAPENMRQSNCEMSQAAYQISSWHYNTRGRCCWRQSVGSYAARSRHKRVGMKHWIGADCGPRSALTWRSCLTTQLEQQRRR